MPDYILTQDASGKWHRAAERDLPDETILQKLIRDHPEVLPLDDLGDEVPPLLIVGRETALLNGYADVIGVDHDGLITIVECKLDRNPEVKRKVIGQVLGYGAYLWGMAYEQFESEVVRKYFNSDRCHRTDWRDMPLDDAMQRFREEQSLGGEWDKTGFREAVTAKLRAGHFRLIIVVDKVNDELRRTIEFLNTCTGPNFEILCAELRYYATDTARLLVPALIGKPSATKTTAKTASSTTWTPERFFPALREHTNDETVQIARRLLTWCDQTFDTTLWGNGMRSGSFNGVVRWDPEHVANLVGVWTYGTIEIGFAYTKVYPPFDQEDKRREWHQRLNAIGTFKLPDDSFNRRPNIPLSALADDSAFNQFTQVLEWAAGELRAAREAK